MLFVVGGREPGGGRRPAGRCGSGPAHPRRAAAPGAGGRGRASGCGRSSEGLANADLQELEGRGLEILYEPDKQRYFQRFNLTLRETDILWTKPSELSFYAALGLPVLMAPTIGSQEDFNREWLLGLEAGIDQGDMRDFEGWFFDCSLPGPWPAPPSTASAGPRQGTYSIIRRLAQPPSR